MARRGRGVPAGRASPAGPGGRRRPRAVCAALLWSSLRAVCAESESSGGVLPDGGPAPAAAAAALPATGPLRPPFEGELSGMELRQVVALSATSVVMCFSTPEHSGCKLSRDFSLEAAAYSSTAAVAPEEAEQGGQPSALDAARGAAAAPEEAEQGSQPGGAGAAAADQGGQLANASAAEETFLPVLQWEPLQRFHSSRASHLEVQRLSEGAFVVCFDHPADPATELTVDGVDPEQYVVACSLGSVATAGGLQPFGPPLRLGTGRLVAVVARGNGRSFSVCAREPAAEANASAACTAVQHAPEELAGDAGGAAAAGGDACVVSTGEAAEGEGTRWGPFGAEDAVAAAVSDVACHWGEVHRVSGGVFLRWADEVVQVQGL